MSESDDEPMPSHLSKRRQRIESDLSPSEGQTLPQEFPPGTLSSNSSQESNDPVMEEREGGRARSRRLQRVFLGSDSSSESGEWKGGSRGGRDKDRGRVAAKRGNQKGLYNNYYATFLYCFLHPPPSYISLSLSLSLSVSLTLSLTLSLSFYLYLTYTLPSLSFLTLSLLSYSSSNVYFMLRYLPAPPTCGLYMHLQTLYLPLLPFSCKLTKQGATT